MTQIIITAQYIISMKGFIPMQTVITVKGLEAMIKRGCSPWIIDGMKKTPAAADYWDELCKNE
jgi:hypothetical protein